VITLLKISVSDDDLFVLEISLQIQADEKVQLTAHAAWKTKRENHTSPAKTENV
jgi:hypothetical protein